MKTKRPSISKGIETDILVKSRRRCCLCVFLNRDISIKQIQIAHLDRDRNNNKPQNLVALCLDHHDQFDSIKSQSKGFTIHEIKYYRDRLYKIIDTRDAKTLNEILGDTKNEDSTEPPSYEWDGIISRLKGPHYLTPYAIGVMDVIGLINLTRIASVFGMDFDKAIFGMFSLINEVLNDMVAFHPKISNLGMANDTILITSQDVDELLSCIKDIATVTNSKITEKDKNIDNIVGYRSGVAWVDSSLGESFKPIKAGTLAFRMSDKAGRKAGQISITKAAYKQLSPKSKAAFKDTYEDSEQGNIYLYDKT
jgi:hypothetical protein